MNEPFDSENLKNNEIPEQITPEPSGLETAEAAAPVEEKPAGKKAKAAKKIKEKAEKSSKKIALNSKKFRQSMAFKFATVLFVLLAVSFVSLAVIMTRSIAADNIKTYGTFETTIAEKTADNLTSWLDSFATKFNVFSKSDAFVSGDWETACDYLRDNRNLIDTNFDFIGIADHDGNMYDSRGNYTDISHEDFFTAVQTQGKSVYISDPVPSPDGYGYIFYVSCPVNNKNNSFWGVIVGTVPLGKVNYQISQTMTGDSGFTYAIDSKGNIIAHLDSERIMKNFYTMSDETSGYTGYKAMTQKMILAQKGSAIIKDNERKVTNYVFYCPINHTDWSLAIAINESIIMSTAKRSAVQTASICLVIGILLLIVASIYLTLLVRPLIQLKNSIIEIAMGDADLTKRIEVKTKDEVGEVVLGFNTFTENLHRIILRIKESKQELAEVDESMAETTRETGDSISKIITHINTVGSQIELQGQSVEETAEKVNQIAGSIESLNNLIENQSSGVTEASAAVEQMLGNITSVTRSTEHMVDSFDQLEENTNTGISKQNSVDEQIQQILEQSRMLMEANKVIQKIASETNLLAMNASIEAAHAGEAGQGFSVVADEIHNLSESSSMQSKRIREELSKIQKSIETVVQSSAEAKVAFQNVTNKIHETDQLVQQIKGAMEESEIGSRQITDALKLMNDSTSDVRDASGNMSAGNQGILAQVQKLQAATEEIKSSMYHMTESANQISDNGQTLTKISETMQGSIAKIGSQIDLFNV